MANKTNANTVKLRHIVDVTADYDAKGDGVTDDSAEIQKAIDAVFAAGGGIVNLPVGTFRCNLVMRNGVILRGSGRGQDLDNPGPSIPQNPFYTFVAGGTTLIPFDRTKPVIKASGSGGASHWPKCSIRDMKISDNNGTIVAGTTGILVELANNVEIRNVEVRNIETGIQMGSTGKTAWGYLLDHVTISDCSTGLLLPNPMQSATPVVLHNVDIRRCTVIGANIQQVQGLEWSGGTIADCVIGLQLTGPVAGGAIASFHGLQFETNTTLAVKVGLADAPSGPAAFYNCHFVDYRGSAGDGSIWPSVFAGSKAIQFNSTDATSELILHGCQFTTYEKCIDTTNRGKVIETGTRMYQCTHHGQVFVSGSADDLSGDSFGVAEKNEYIGLGSTRLTYKSNDLTTYANNFWHRPANANGANVSGLISNGTGSFSAWQVCSGSDPDNTHYLTTEAGSDYVALESNKRGTGTVRDFRIRSNGATKINLKANGDLAFFGVTGSAQPTGYGTPTNISKTANLPGTAATLAQVGGTLAALIADLKALGLIAA